MPQPLSAPAFDDGMGRTGEPSPIRVREKEPLDAATYVLVVDDRGKY